MGSILSLVTIFPWTHPVKSVVGMYSVFRKILMNFKCLLVHIQYEGIFCSNWGNLRKYEKFVELLPILKLFHTHL